jgi:AcrR family transcriptional regulator
MARHGHFPKPLTAAQQRIQRAALRLFAEKGMYDVNVRDLALKARVARGTIYNTGQNSMKDVFEEIVSRLSAEMFERVGRTLEGTEDPAQRLSNAMRFFIRRAYEEPDWGAFMMRFAINDDCLRQMWNGHPRKDIAAGITKGRYKLRPEQVPSAVMMVAGNTIGAMFLALHGHRSWRAAGSDAVELTLRAFGTPPQMAKTAATSDLPALLSID